MDEKTQEDEAPWCPYCGATAVLTTGATMIPHAPWRAEQRLWACVPCEAYVGCHKESSRAMGLPARSDLRMTRQRLHEDVLDPLWRNAHRSPCYATRELDEAAIRGIARRARSRVYAWLAEHMDLATEEGHVGMFDLDECRRAEALLRAVTYEDIRAWCHPFEEARRIVRQHQRREARREQMRFSDAAPCMEA